MTLTTPARWSHCERESRIAEFVDGIMCNNSTEQFEVGDTYLLWTEKEFDIENMDEPDLEESDLTDEGVFPLHSNRSNDIPEGTKYLVEFKQKGHLVEEHFFETQEEAERFIDSETPDPDPDA